MATCSFPHVGNPRASSGASSIPMLKTFPLGAQVIGLLLLLSIGVAGQQFALPIFADGRMPENVGSNASTTLFSGGSNANFVDIPLPTEPGVKSCSTYTKTLLPAEYWYLAHRYCQDRYEDKYIIDFQVQSVATDPEAHNYFVHYGDSTCPFPSVEHPVFGMKGQCDFYQDSKIHTGYYGPKTSGSISFIAIYLLQCANKKLFCSITTEVCLDLIPHTGSPDHPSYDYDLSCQDEFLTVREDGYALPLWAYITIGIACLIIIIVICVCVCKRYKRNKAAKAAQASLNSEPSEHEPLTASPISEPKPVNYTTL